MSDSGKAVFLSYASQDAEAAKRICEALRAAGVEVWFDQYELVGGDAWDQKIRKQIRDCALLIPVISQTTQARREAYFRLEWKLAEERTHLMAKGTPFLLPVTIDETSDRDALVPDAFLAVQWTRLRLAGSGVASPPEGEDPALVKFAARVKRLLDGSPVAESAEPGASPVAPRPGSAPPTAVPAASGARWVKTVLASAALVIVALGVTLYQRASPKAPAPTAAAPVPAPPESEARQLTRQARELLYTAQGVTRERLEAADELCRRALAADPLDPVVLARAAIVDSHWVFYEADVTDARRQQASKRATQAALFAPADREVRFAQASVYAWVIATPAMRAEAVRIFRDLVKEYPDDRGYKEYLGTLLRDMNQLEEAARIFEEIGALHSAGWAYVFLKDWGAALRLADAQLARGHSGPALIQKYAVMRNSRGDLKAMGEVVAQFTPEDLLLDNVAHAAFEFGLITRDSKLLQETARTFPRDVISVPVIGTTPKRYFTGWAHEFAGRPEFARTEWRAALTTVEDLRKTRPDDQDLLYLQASMNARLGRRAEADAALQTLLSLKPAEMVAVFVRMSVRASLGDTEDALGLLPEVRRAFAGLTPDLKVWWHLSLRWLPEVGGIRGDPRFQELLRETQQPSLAPLEAATPAKP